MNQKSAILLLSSQFDELAQRLNRPENAERLRRRLSEWTAVSDRSVPFALLDKTVQELLSAGFDAAASTDGVGIKKLRGLITLLERACNDPLSVAWESGDSQAPARSVFGATATRLRFAARPFLAVSEIDWDRWRHAVVARELADDPIGRYIETLRQLPRAAWQNPLSFYISRTLGQLFGLPLHGGQRVAAIAAVFQRLASHRGERDSADRPEAVVEFLQAVRKTTTTARALPAGFDPLAPVSAQIGHDLGPQAVNVFTVLVGLPGRAEVAVKPAGWSRYYRESIRQALAVRCPEAISLVAETLKKRKSPLTADTRARLARFASLFGE
jgi:hypothetical protein